MAILRWTVLCVVGLLVVLLLIGWTIASMQQPKMLGELIKVGDEELHIVDQGQGSPILIMHGASGNLGDMELRLAPALRSAGHRVVTVDRPGLGFSSRNDAGLKEIEAQAAVMADLIDELKMDKPVIVGHSLGGAVALALTLNHPEKVGRLVDISGVSHPWDGDIWWVHQLAGTPGFGWYFCNALAPTLGLVMFDASVESTFTPEPAVENYADETQTGMIMQPRRFCNNSADVRALNEGVARLQPRYSALTAPFDVVFGTEDYVSPDLHAAGLERDAPGANITLIDGAGHMIHHTQFETVRDIILAAARSVAEAN